MKVLFIGNRFNVLESLLDMGYFDIEILSLRNSFLENILTNKKISFKTFDINDKESVLITINYGDYDILISNGCPFIIPITEFISKKKLINIHPTYLPELRGKTALNGVFFNDFNHIGATMHFISNEIDGGNIIYQEKVPISEDIDQGLVYYLSFWMEAVVFNKGWKLLVDNNFLFEGYPQNLEEGCYFNRTTDKMIIDFSTMKTTEILKRIKSFGIMGQGCKLLNSRCFEIERVYEAQQIVNPFLLDIYSSYKEGEVLLRYDSKYLVKTLDGIIKIVRYD